MPYFRKKPAVIQAARFTGEDPSELVELGMEYELPEGEPVDFLMVETLEGDMRASAGDWVILGVAGELYPCKPDIFTATYEPVEGGG